MFIEAPRAAINRVIASNNGVRELVDNGWLHLFAIEIERAEMRENEMKENENQGERIYRYSGDMHWSVAESSLLPSVSGRSGEG